MYVFNNKGSDRRVMNIFAGSSLIIHTDNAFLLSARYMLFSGCSVQSVLRFKSMSSFYKTWENMTVVLLLVRFN